MRGADKFIDEDPTFAIGQGSTWTGSTHATRLFLARTPGVHPVRAVGIDGWRRCYSDAIASWGVSSDMAEALGRHFERLRSRWQETSGAAAAEEVAGEANRLLAAAGDDRRLHALDGRGTPYALRYVLLTPAQRQALEAAGLAAFKPSSGGGGGGFFAKFRKLFG